MRRTEIRASRILFVSSIPVCIRIYSPANPLTASPCQVAKQSMGKNATHEGEAFLCGFHVCTELYLAKTGSAARNGKVAGMYTSV